MAGVPPGCHLPAWDNYLIWVDVKVMELEAITVVDDDHGNYK